MPINFSLNRTELWRFQNIPNSKDSYSKNYAEKTKNSKQNSKYKKILRITMLMNTGPLPELSICTWKNVIMCKLQFRTKLKTINI